MLEQIKQVGITYLTQRYLWWFAAVLSVMHAAKSGFDAAGRSAGRPPMPHIR